MPAAHIFLPVPPYHHIIQFYFAVTVMANCVVSQVFFCFLIRRSVILIADL